MEEQKGFDFQQFINDSRDVLLSPKDFFPNLALSGGLGEPLIKVLIYGALAGMFNMIWSFMHIGSVFGGAFGIGALFATIIGAIIGAFIMGVIFLILSSICGGNTDYEANFRVAVALMVVYPISSFLNVLGGLSYWISALVGLAVNLYALYILYYGLTIALKGKEETARVVGYVLAGLLVLSMLIAGATRQAAKSFTGFGTSRFEQKLKDFEKIAKEMEKSAKEDYKSILEDLEANDSESVEYADMDDTMAKPRLFPEEAAEFAKDWFAKGELKVTDEKIEKLIDVTKELKTLGNNQQAEQLKIIEIYGYSGIEEYQKDYLASIMAFEGLKGLIALQKLIDASSSEQKVAQAFTLDKAVESIVKQTFATGNVTRSDVDAAFKNWNQLVELSKLSQRD